MELASVPATYLPQLRSDVSRIVDLLHDLDAARAATTVPDCPDWDVRTLVIHLGAVHRWATASLATGEPGRPERVDVPSADLATWFAEGAEHLIAGLEATDPEAATWHPFADDPIAAVWFRRQTHETAIHRRDLEVALDRPRPIPAAIASDAIDEHLESGLVRALARRGGTLPTASLHVHCTDVPGEWLVWNDDGRLGLRREHAKGDAAIRGPAEAILLHLLHRAGAHAGTHAGERTDTAIDVVGDADAAVAWLTLPSP